ncbi:unnamed protein product [Leptidea sinapis]|uniref:THAP-type domain-containing protein n=1 Tax=Leptidea sinapis TaxID=189913 RepID=A0A5E4Q8U8_9NEOP|nr:unnamed protein product [Leptidea sinapis]
MTMCRKWLTIIDRHDLLQKADINFKSYFVCSAHFEDSSFKIIKHLKEDALPSILLYNQPEEGSSCSELQSTSSTELQSSSAQIKDKSRDKMVILSYSEEYATVGTQTESLKSTQD